MKKKAIKKVDEYMLSVGEIKRHMGALSEEYQGRLDGVIEQVGGIHKKLDSHTEMIGKIMVQLQEIQSDMKQRVDLQQFARLEKRVALVEAKLHR